MIKLLKSFFLNGLAHYNLSNRIEYLKLIFRLNTPSSRIIKIDLPLRVDFIYIISLRDKYDRRNFIKRQLGNQGIEFSFEDATKGYDETFASVISNRSVSYLSLGSIGCWISHYKVWNIVARISDCFVIIEDDVRIYSDFMHKLNCSIELIPGDADIIYINSGNNYLRNMRYLVNNIAFVPYQIRNGAYAYCLTKKGAVKLLELIPFVEVTRGGIDSAIGVLIRNKKINAYHLLKPLCEVNFSFGSSTK